MKKKLLYLGVLFTLCGLLVACGATEPKVLPEPSLVITEGILTEVQFEGLEVISVEPPIANLGNLEVWLEEGQVAELIFDFGNANGRVVVTPDPAYVEGLTIGLVDSENLRYVPAITDPENLYTYTGISSGKTHIYVAAMEFAATHFWVRLEQPE